MSNLHLTSLVVDGGDPSLCPYLLNGDKASRYVVITFNSVPGMTATTVQSGLTAGQTNVKTVAGLADAAFSFNAAPDWG